MKITSELINGIWLTTLNIGVFGTQAQDVDSKTSIIKAHQKMLTVLFKYKNIK